MPTADASPFSSMEACSGDVGSASVRNLGNPTREAGFSTAIGVVTAVVCGILSRFPNRERGCEGIYTLEPEQVAGWVRLGWCLGSPFRPCLYW